MSMMKMDGKPSRADRAATATPWATTMANRKRPQSVSRCRWAALKLARKKAA